MTNPQVPQQVFVLSSTTVTTQSDEYGDLESRRGEHRGPSIPKLTPVHITELQSQVAIFVQQLDVVMSKLPEHVSGYQLDEFEVSVGIVAEGSGGVTLAFLANAEVSGGVNASMKFVFKRS